VKQNIYFEASSGFCVSAHRLPCIALVTLTQCSGFKEAFLDDDWVDSREPGRPMFRPFAPNEALDRPFIPLGGGGGAPFDETALDPLSPKGGGGTAGTLGSFWEVESPGFDGS